MSENLPEFADTWAVFDPHCGTRGAEVVARNFKSKESADLWLEKKVSADEGGYVGCIVVPNAELPAYGARPTLRAAMSERLDHQEGGKP